MIIIIPKLKLYFQELCSFIQLHLSQIYKINLLHFLGRIPQLKYY